MLSNFALGSERVGSVLYVSRVTQMFSKNQRFNCTKKLEYWLLFSVDLCMSKQMLHHNQWHCSAFLLSLFLMFYLLLIFVIFQCTCAFRALVGLFHQLFKLF